MAMTAADRCTGAVCHGPGGSCLPYHRTMQAARLRRLLGDDGPMGRALAGVLLVTAWVATWRPQVDPDAWWHLALGDRIVATGSIPAIEPFSWLTAGSGFVEHSWLWDVLLSGAWAAGGATATSLLIVPVTALIVWTTWRLIGLAADDLPPIGRAALVMLALVAALPLWAPRGQTIDVAFVLVTVLVLARYLRLGSRPWLALLPLLGLAWANLHGSGVLALAVSVALALAAGPIGARWGAWPRRPIGPLLVAGAAGMVAAVINPYGPALLTYPFAPEVASAFSPAIVEWRSPDFAALELWPFRAILAGLLLVAVRSDDRPRDPFLLLSAALWTFAALGAVRFLSIAAPLVVVAAAPVVGSSLRRWIGGEAARAEASRPRDPVTTASRGPASAIALAAIVGILASGWLLIEPGRQEAAIARRLPVDAVAALEAAGPDCDLRLLPAYDWAGYVTWRTGRSVGAYGNSAAVPVTEQARLELVARDPRPWLDEFEVDIVLVHADGPLSRWLDEADDWRPAYRDPQATVHVRAGSSTCQLGRSVSSGSLPAG